MHNRIFAVGSILLCLAALPALVKGIHTPVWTAALTAGVLLAFGCTYMRMKWYLASATVTVQAVLWTAILIQELHV